MRRAAYWPAVGSALFFIVAFTGCGGAPSSPAASVSTAPATFTAKVKLRDQTVPRWNEGENCDSGHYGSLSAGSEVRIEAKGNTVAKGKIANHGIMAPRSDSGYFCDYEFAIDEVPAGMGFYTINLGEKLGHKEVSEADLKAGVELETSTFEGIK